MGTPRKLGPAKLTIREVEQFARWSIAAQFFADDDDETRLQLVREEVGRDHWTFDFNGDAGTAYHVEMVQPDGVPLAVAANVARRLVA